MRARTLVLAAVIGLSASPVAAQVDQDDISEGAYDDAPDERLAELVAPLSLLLRGYLSYPVGPLPVGCLGNIWSAFNVPYIAPD